MENRVEKSWTVILPFVYIRVAHFNVFGVLHYLHLVVHYFCLFFLLCLAIFELWLFWPIWLFERLGFHLFEYPRRRQGSVETLCPRVS